MARIRSVHPGLWTDERFASVSPLARLMFIGIWNECDDAGSFEWSPIKLKMRILPADNADPVSLLEELEAAGCVVGYEIDGRKLGAVRNFTRYQRPKKPNSVYPQTDEVRDYCGGEANEVRNQLPTGGEIAPQMEEGGGNRSSVTIVTGADAPQNDPDKVFWDTAKSYLAPHVKGDPGSYIGKCCRDYGKAETARAITQAQIERAVAPIPFITACLKGGKAKQPEYGPC